MSQTSENSEKEIFDPALLRPPSGVILESVLITEEIHQRPSRPTDHETEANALLVLSEHLANSPHTVFQKLTDVTLNALHVGSAGVSLVSEENGNFFWPAIAGEWSAYVGGGTPRDFSPSSVVLDRNAGQLFCHPERYYPYLLSAEPKIEEVLLCPFYVKGVAVGTVWAVAHDVHRQFDSEDIRLLQSLSKFASAAYSTWRSTERLESERERLRQREQTLSNSVEELQEARLAALNLMEDAVEDRKLVEDLNRRLSATASRDAYRVTLADTLRPLDDAEHIQAQAARVLGAQLAASRALYVDVEPDETHIVVHDDYTDGVASVAGRYNFQDFGSFVAEGCRAGRTITVSNVQQDSRLDDAEKQTYASLQIQAYVAVPLVKTGRLVAIFGVHNVKPRDWTSEEITLVEDTAERTWAIIERAKVEQALRESEERFRMLADHMSQLAWTCDELGDANWYNQRWLEYTGCTMDELRNRGWTTFQHPDYVKRVEESVSKSRESGEIWEDTFPLRGKDGTYRWFLSRAVPIKDDSGVIRRWFGTNTDITVQREVEQALRESERSARQASISKSEFLANMSHEIRTPMAAILGHADVLLTHLNDGDNRGCVETIKRNGNHLLEIINDILDLSRIEAGKLDVELESCNPAEMLADIWSLMHVRVEGRPVELNLVCDGKLPAVITTDPKRLRQILVNLIGNAIKFTEEGQVNILTSCQWHDNQYLIRFEVQDTGIGISEEHLAKLFKPFSQVDSSVTRKFGGTGLGLSISKRLVSMLGGQLTVESQLEVGSTFCVELPVGELDGVTFVECEVSKKSPQTKEPPGKECLNCRVLLVDDRRDVRFIAQHFLESAGATIRSANDGRAAIDAIFSAEQEGMPFDIVVMDMQMPIMDGYAATSELRARGFDRPIIALTANAMAGDEERCLDVGCDDYQSKPIDAKELIEKVQRLTETTLIDTLQAERNRRKAESNGANRRGISRNSLHMLVVDENVEDARATALLLKLEGYQTTLCHSGQATIRIAAELLPDCIVMDTGLPDIGGHEVARKLRENGFRGVLVLHSRTIKDQDEQELLRAGFDYHLKKPADKNQIEELIKSFRPESHRAARKKLELGIRSTR